RHTRFSRDWSSDVCSSDLFSPDNMIEAFIDDDRVRIGMADWFSRPMRLTPQDVVALVTAGKTVLRFDPAFQGEEADGGEVPALEIGRASGRERVESAGGGG